MEHIHPCSFLMIQKSGRNLLDFLLLDSPDRNANPVFSLAGIKSYFIVKITDAGLFRRHIPADLSTRSDPLFFFFFFFRPVSLPDSLTSLPLPDCLVCIIWADTLQVGLNQLLPPHVDTYLLKLQSRDPFRARLFTWRPWHLREMLLLSRRLSFPWCLYCCVNKNWCDENQRYCLRAFQNLQRFQRYCTIYLEIMTEWVANETIFFPHLSI